MVSHKKAFELLANELSSRNEIIFKNFIGCDAPRKTYLEDVLSIRRVQLNGLFTPGLLGIGRKVVSLQVLMKSRYS